jgi:hypothetical protein
MNCEYKYVCRCLFAIAALILLASRTGLAQTVPSLGSAQTFAVLGGSAVTCTNSVISGDVGVSPTPAFTNVGCTIAGTVHVNDQAAINARAAFLGAYDALELTPCSQTIATAAFTGNVPALGPLPPGVYCFPAAVTFTDTTLTLDGSTNPNGIWIFKVGAALSGNGFQVVMANGAQPCNVFWAVGAGVTLTTSTLPPLFQGNILAGGPTGSITTTGGGLVGRALANDAVTMTSTNVHGTCALLNQGKSGCDADDNDEHHHGKDGDKDRDRDKDRDKDKDRDNRDKGEDHHNSD